MLLLQLILLVALYLLERNYLDLHAVCSDSNNIAASARRFVVVAITQQQTPFTNTTYHLFVNYYYYPSLYLVELIYELRYCAMLISLIRNTRNNVPPFSLYQIIYYHHKTDLTLKIGFKLVKLFSLCSLYINVCVRMRAASLSTKKEYA